MCVHQLPMGRGDHPHVERRQASIRTDALNLAGLEESKEQRLHAQAHLAHFVHEDRAAVGRFEPAPLVAVRVGEAALDVTEHLRLEE